MRKYSFVIILFCVLVFTACTDSSNNQVMRWTTNDLSSLRVYHGSEEGGVRDTIALPQEGEEIKDRNRWYMNTQFDGLYRENKFSQLRVEFLDDLVIYTNPLNGRKTMSSYQFKEDSLFINKSNGTTEFIARGTKDTLYREEFFYGHSVSEDVNKIVEYNKKVDLQLVLDSAGYHDLKEMKSKAKDRIMWCNVRYMITK